MTTESPANEASYAEFRPSIWHRLGFRFAYAPLHDDDLYSEELGWAPGALINETFVRLDWADRIRALISGQLHVQTRTKTDQVVRRSSATSAARVLPPTFGFEVLKNTS